MEDRIRLHRIILTSISIRRQKTVDNKIIIIQFRDERLTLIEMNHCRILRRYQNINPFSEDVGMIFPVVDCDEHCVDKVTIKVDNNEIHAMESRRSYGYNEDRTSERYRLVKINDYHYKTSIRFNNRQQDECPSDILKIKDDIVTCYVNNNIINVVDRRGSAFYNKITHEVDINNNRWCYSSSDIRMKAIEMMKKIYNIE